MINQIEKTGFNEDYFIYDLLNHMIKNQI